MSEVLRVEGLTKNFAKKGIFQRKSQIVTAVDDVNFSLNQNEILFLNPAVHHEGGFNLWSRKNLTLRLSKDDGKTWTGSRTLNEGLAGYSDMAIKKNGQILCVFENGKRDYCEKISIVCLNRSWLTAREKKSE